jgi:hypothetical protein
VQDEHLTHLHELARSSTVDWIQEDMKKKSRSRAMTQTRKKLISSAVGVVGGGDKGKGGDGETERNSSPSRRHMNDLANTLETHMAEFLKLINTGILCHEQTTLGNNHPVRYILFYLLNFYFFIALFHYLISFLNFSFIQFQFQF